jgi:hypothetical protein
MHYDGRCHAWSEEMPCRCTEYTERPVVTKREDGAYTAGPPPHGNTVDERVAELTEDPASRKLQRKLSIIHALAKHLLGVEEDDARDLFVGVHPNGKLWRVRVSYMGFQIDENAAALDDALDKVTQHLVGHVARKLDQGTRLLTIIDSKRGTRLGTRKVIEDAVRECHPEIEGVDVEESNAPGHACVRIRIKPGQSIALRDQMCVAVGKALERNGALGITFDVEVTYTYQA